jgi:putative membrane protein
MMSRIRQEEIASAIKRRPTDALAFGRTAMANRRTLLSFLRTGIGLLGGGIGIIGFLERPLIVALGWLAVILSVPLLVWGIRNYIRMNKLLTEVATEVFGTDENPEKGL